MDLTSGAREFHDIEDEEEKELEQMMKSMTWKEKLVYRLKNW